MAGLDSPYADLNYDHAGKSVLVILEVFLAYLHVITKPTGAHICFMTSEFSASEAFSVLIG